MGNCWNRLITSYSGHFLACQGVDCTFRWKGLIGNDNLLTEWICQPTSPGCLSASTATISTGRLADRSCCQRPQAHGWSSISPALVSVSARICGSIPGWVQIMLHSYFNLHTTSRAQEYKSRLVYFSRYKRQDSREMSIKESRTQILSDHQSSSTRYRTSKPLKYFSFLGPQNVGWYDRHTIGPQFPLGPCSSVDMSRN